MALHGRTIEQARIAALLDDVRGGHSGVLVVRGEPGAGKSSLLEAAVAGAEGMHVVRGAGVEAEAPLAYAVLHQMLWPWRERSASIPAPQRHALRIALGLKPGTAADRFLVSAAVLSLLGALAETRPVLCAVDDVQWVDPASGDALLFAARRLMAEQVAIVFALRDGEAGRFDAPGLPELTLGPLDPSAARELLAEAAGTAVVPAVASRLVEATGGNPLALAEIGPLLDAEHLSGLAPLPDPLPLGAGVERAYTARAHALPGTTQTALLVAAIEARGDLDTVLAATGTLGADPAALDPAEQAGLVSTGSGRLRFRHPLVRSAVAQAAPFGRRRAAHLALAATLADQDDDRAVWHRAGAAVGPDPGLAEELVAAAARSRTRGDTVAAAAALKRAADLVAPSRRAPLLAQAAADSWQGGRAADASALIERTHALGPEEPERRRIERLRGTIEAWAGHPERACEILCREAEVASAAEPAAALELLAEASEAASFAGDAALAARVGELAESLTAPGNDPWQRLLHRLLLGMHWFSTGRMEEAAPMLGETVAIARELDDLRALTWGCRAAIYLGDDEATVALNHRASERARESGAVIELAPVLIRTALAQVWRGRLGAGETDASEARRLAEATGQEDLVACGLATLAYVAALRGEADRCREHAEQALNLGARRGLRLFSDYARAALGHLDLVQGRPMDALAHLRGVAHPSIVLGTTIDRVETAVQAREPELAAEWLAAAERFERVAAVPALAPLVAHARGVLADPGDDVACFEQAVELHAGVDRPFELARTELAWGWILRRRRRRVEAREHLRAAFEGFERLGAAGWAERAQSELRASGQTARRRDPSTLDDLTPQERQVANLVAEGRTNREVAAQLLLSPRTIDFHLRNVFAKLGITSRAELAARKSALD